MKRLFIVLVAIAASAAMHAQDLDAYKRHVSVLASKTMEGRGYVNDGVRKAEEYIVKEYEKAGVDEIILQPFTIDINTFPGKVKMSVDGQSLRPGDDFTAREFSIGAKGTYKLVYIDTLGYDAQAIMEKLSDAKYKDYYGVIDFLRGRRLCKEFRESGAWNDLPLAGMIYQWRDPLKFYKAYGEKVSQKPVLWVSKDFPKDAKSIKVNIQNEFREGYLNNNIIARIKGESSDSTLVLMAHYDHLGHFGKDQYYPGVNDNASGTAALLTLAAYYAQNKPRFDIVFLSVAAEETGLRGSEYYVQHPIYPLDQIKYLVNIDMIGDNAPAQYCEISDEGLQGLELMREFNSVNDYFTELNRGTLAANSDHYPFAQNHVPCVMFEQEDGDCFQYYHTYHDDLEHAQYETYPKIFSLVLNLFATL